MLSLDLQAHGDKQGHSGPHRAGNMKRKPNTEESCWLCSTYIHLRQQGYNTNNWYIIT